MKNMPTSVHLPKPTGSTNSLFRRKTFSEGLVGSTGKYKGKIMETATAIATNNTAMLSKKYPRDGVEKRHVHEGSALVRARDLRPSQKARVVRVVRYFKRTEGYNGVTSVRYTLTRCDWGGLYLTVNTRRSDCGRYSQRAICCAVDAHFSIGQRGGLTMLSYRSGLSGRKHNSEMAVYICDSLSCTNKVEK